MVMETTRLRLREMAHSDADALFTVFSDPQVTRFYPRPFDRQMVATWIERNTMRYSRDGFGLWVVLLAQTGELIGDCGLVVQEVDGADEIEIGYHIRPDLWGNGYATEAARACRDWGFHRLNATRLVSLIHPDNTASVRVAEKTGMNLVRQTIWRDQPTCLYAVDRHPGEAICSMSPSLRTNSRGHGL